MISQSEENIKKIQKTQQIPTQMIVEYTQQCIDNHLQQNLHPDVRGFIERIENWDLHCPNSATWTGQNSQLGKQKDFISRVLDSAFQLIKSSKAKILFLFQHKARGKTILREIAHSSFLRLRWLSLVNNRIDNIETIAFLDAPLLERLDLNRNDITISKALSKTKFIHLKRLNIQTNLIKSLDLSRGQWALQIDTFHIEGNKDAYSVDPWSESSGPFELIFKINSQKVINISRFCFKEDTRWSVRIKQLKLIPKLSQRFNREKQNWNVFSQ